MIASTSAAPAAQLDALELVARLRSRLSDYASDACYVRDSRLRHIAHQLWAGKPCDGGLVSDIWVEAAFPAKCSGDSLDSLVAAGSFPKDLAAHLDRRGVLPSSRYLYTHQSAALEQSRSTGDGTPKPALIITAGTGAGKTEAFLLPVLRDLWERKQDQELGSTQGARCLILYPMNALVNDQVGRLHQWLTGQDRLSLFHFTGETPEDDQVPLGQRAPEWKDSEHFRVRTRQEARGLRDHIGKLRSENDRGRQPDIVVTNYSMLEYMLCRPQDSVFFGSALQCVVLDEAHLYTGTLAAEIMLLLRRLLLRCGKNPDDVLFIATSATITEDDTVLKRFGETLFTKREDNVQIVRGSTAELDFPAVDPPSGSVAAADIAAVDWLTHRTLVRETNGDMMLAEDPEQADTLRKLLPRLVNTARIDSWEKKPALLLARALPYAPKVQHLAWLLSTQKRIRLDVLAHMVWQETTETATSEAVTATAALLKMAAAAREQPGNYPVVPHRLHALARTADGLFVCINPGCSGPSERHLSGLGMVGAGWMDCCPACHSATAALYRCINCGEWAIARPEADRAQPEVGVQTVRLWHVCKYESELPQRYLDIRSGASRGTGPGLPVTHIEHCPHCNADADDADDDADLDSAALWPTRGCFVPMIASSGLALSLTAETALAELPSYPSSDSQFLPAQGRRLLAFSDSRAEAARLGVRLTYQHEIQMVRALLVRTAMDQGSSTPEATRQAAEQLQLLEAQVASNPAMVPYLRTAIEELRNAVRGAQVGGTIQSWKETIMQRPELAELMDPESGTQHDSTISPSTLRTNNQKEIEIRLPLLLARELASPQRKRPSVETIGMLEVTYPGYDDGERFAPPAFLGRLPTQQARDGIREVWSELLASLLDTIREDGAITLGNDEQDDEFSRDGRRLGEWLSRGDEPPGSGWARFAGAIPKQRRRQFLARILERLGLNATEADSNARELLLAIFDLLWNDAQITQTGWLECRLEAGVRLLRLRFDQLGIRPLATVYHSPCTGLLFPRSVLGHAPSTGCNDLIAVPLDDLVNLRHGRQRDEFLHSPIFSQGLWAEEHSAQLSAEENHRLQDLFKAGMRNVLSSTTTMELGIDIGGLSGVLMGNVPPGKANYLQRAGRAGRRADGSSIALTFARPRPYDRAVFHRFDDYLDTPLREPIVLGDRERLVRRHLHALLLGKLFEKILPTGKPVGAMNAFGNMGVFCGVSLPPQWNGNQPQPVPQRLDHNGRIPVEEPWWNEARAPGTPEGWFVDYLQWAKEHGAETLYPYLERLLVGTALDDLLSDAANRWESLFDEIRQSFTYAVLAWRRDFDFLRATWSMLDDTPEEKRRANAIQFQLQTMAQVTVIEALADRQFLPRYGFPIGLQSLRVVQVKNTKQGRRIREEDQYRLERAGLQAIREYVPGATVLAGGKQWVSRGIIKHWSPSGGDSSFGRTGFIGVCMNGHRHYWLTGERTAPCPICDQPLDGIPSPILLPEHGFTTAAWEFPRRRADVDAIGFVQAATVTFSDLASREAIEVLNDFAGIAGLTAKYRADGEILSFNKGKNGRGFFLCLTCGFSESEEANGELPDRIKSHASLFGTSRYTRCPCNSHKRHLTIAARQTTDVLLLDFAGVPAIDTQNQALVYTMAQACQIAAAAILQLDTREIGVLLTDTETGYGAVLYDNTPGGAGHVRELTTPANARRWMTYAANRVLFVNHEHDSQCSLACFDCLLTYDAQSAMRRGLLDRRSALRAFEAIGVFIQPK